MTTRTKCVKKGDWRTLEWFWNSTGSAYFILPAGAKIKVRYGVGYLGWDSQKQTLNGKDKKTLSVGRGSVAYARMQMKVTTNTDVFYEIHP